MVLQQNRHIVLNSTRFGKLYVIRITILIVCKQKETQMLLLIYKYSSIIIMSMSRVPRPRNRMSIFKKMVPSSNRPTTGFKP